MATFSNQSEHFYDDISNRSPRSFRGPQMNRQPLGRPDSYPAMPGMFGADNSIPSLRFGGGGGNMRDPFAPLSSAGNNMNFPYDMHAAQTWNGAAGLPPSFPGNGLNMTQNGDFGPRGVKGSRGRPTVGNVSSLTSHFH
jgi:hypothetical protein